MKKSDCFQKFIKYSSLNVLGMLGLSCYILADTFFVSKGLGANGLAALNLAIPIYGFIHGCGLMIGMGGGIKYSIQKSQNERKSVNQLFTNALYLVGILSIVFVLIGIFLSDNIVAFLGADENVFHMTKTYLQVILLFAPAFLMNNALLCFVRNDGDPKLPMIAMIVGSLSNIVLDYIFIFPLGMGMFGAVFATGLAPVISILTLSLHFIRKKNGFRIAKCRLKRKITTDIISNGVPSLITELSSGIVIIIFNFIILNLRGSIGVAAYGVIANISLVIISIYTGIAQGIQPLMSLSYGEGNKQNLRSILRYALTTMLIISIITYVVIFFGAGKITEIFNSEQNILLKDIATEGFKLYFIACPFVGFNIIISIYFTSMEYPMPAHIISVLRGFIVIIPMAFILSHIAEIIGIWCAFPATELLVAVIGIMLLIIHKNKKHKVLK